MRHSENMKNVLNKLPKELKMEKKIKKKFNRFVVCTLNNISSGYNKK